ncbi:DUF5992 family protein [Gynuella sunshinyii]|uniref:DUF5992 family protein n=1 Tax=Gynuella sunshinyii TaxID=1445505 RepID=UPI001184FA95|nr:DUF5992 family protein [Gynuella sunshinyii]
MIQSTTCFAGYVVTDGIITKVANSEANNDRFVVSVSGGSGPCANQNISFPKGKAGSPEIFTRAFSMALTGLSTGMKVRIHNYESDDCFNAAWIELSK